MISGLSAGAELFLADVGRAQRRLTEAGSQVSSGKKLTGASDDPNQVQALLQLRADRARNAQIQSNLGLAETDAATADSALTAAVKLMDSARALAAQGASETLDPAARKSMAGEAQSLLEQMVVVSATTVQGRYIFSGDGNGAPAYELDLAAPEGVAQVSNAAATRRIERPSGGSFPAAMTAGEIFDARTADGAPAGDNVFAALNSLRLGLENNDAQAVASATASISQAAGRLGSAQAFYGTVERRVQDAAQYAASYDIQLQTQLSGVEDADVAAAAVELTQANTQVQAAFQMRAKLPTRTLFDYLA